MIILWYILKLNSAVKTNYTYLQYIYIYIYIYLFFLSVEGISMFILFDEGDSEVDDDGDKQRSHELDSSVILATQQ